MSDEPFLRPLTWERHGSCMWRRFRSYDFASGVECVPLAGQELSQAALSLPIAFQSGEPGWQVVALLGLEAGRNLCMDKTGRWQGRYVPAALRSHPFGVMPGCSEILCIDEASPHLIESYDGEPLFNEQGQRAAFVASIHDFLKAYEHGRWQLAEMARRLNRAGLLVPWSSTALAVRHQVYRIDESRWNALDDEQLLALRHQGVMPLVYAQLLSQPNLAWLQQRLGDRPEQAPYTTSGSTGPDSGSVLDEWRDVMAAETHYEWHLSE